MAIQAWNRHNESNWAGTALACAVVTLLAVVPGYALVVAISAIAGANESLQDILAPERWAKLLGNTLVVSGLAVATSVIIGGSLGFLVARTNLPGRRLLIAVLLLAACVPVYVLTTAFFALIPSYHLMGSAATCGVLHGAIRTPLVALLLGLAFRLVDREQEDLALLDTSAGWVWLRVTLPQSSWAIVSATVLVFLLVATDITITDVLAVRTFAEESYTQYALANRSAGPLLTALPVAGVLAIVLGVMQTRVGRYGTGNDWTAGALPRIHTLGWIRVPLGGVCWLLALAAVGTPLAALGRYLQPASEIASAFWGVQREVWTSLGLGAAGATVIVLVAIGLAQTVLRGGWLRWPAVVVLIVVLALPAPVVGISLKEMFNRPGLLGWIHDSPAMVCVGYVVRYLPLGVLLLLSGVRRLARDVDDAARLDGCGLLRLWWHVRWPTIRWDVALAWLVVLIFCFAEVGTTVLLHAPGWPTASVRFATLIHFGVYRDLAALALLSAAAILIPWALLIWLLKNGLRTTQRVW